LEKGDDLINIGNGIKMKKTDEISIRAMFIPTENDILWIFPREIGAGYVTNKK